MLGYNEYLTYRTMGLAASDQCFCEELDLVRKYNLRPLCETNWIQFKLLGSKRFIEFFNRWNIFPGAASFLRILAELNVILSQGKVLKSYETWFRRKFKSTLREHSFEEIIHNPPYSSWFEENFSKLSRRLKKLKIEGLFREAEGWLQGRRWRSFVTQYEKLLPKIRRNQMRKAKSMDRKATIWLRPISMKRRFSFGHFPFDAPPPFEAFLPPVIPIVKREKEKKSESYCGFLFSLFYPTEVLWSTMESEREESRSFFKFIKPASKFSKPKWKASFKESEYGYLDIRINGSIRWSTFKKLVYKSVSKAKREWGIKIKTIRRLRIPEVRRQIYMLWLKKFYNLSNAELGREFYKNSLYDDVTKLIYINKDLKRAARFIKPLR